VIPAISGAIGPLGPAEWSVGSIGGAAQNGVAGVDPTGASGSGSFSSALTGAINSLDQTQNVASTAATQLADGQSTDPTKAITAVENASMSMDLASQIQSKLITDLNTIYQTQV
jgi:flagellar hook-basal body complex protein FliE